MREKGLREKERERVRKIVCEREKGLREKERVRERRTMLENPSHQNVNEIEQVCNNFFNIFTFQLVGSFKLRLM